MTSLNTRIVNVVYTVEINAPLHLANIFKHTKNCEYNPDRFAALKHRFRRDGDAPTFLVFPTGKIVCVGTSSPEKARQACLHLLRHLAHCCGVDVEDATHTIRNIVSSTSLPHPVDLLTFSALLPLQTTYEPEVFPGLTYKSTDATYLLFSSGKVVITGLTRETQLTKCIEHLQWLSQVYQTREANTH